MHNILTLTIRFELSCMHSNANFFIIKMNDCKNKIDNLKYDKVREVS